MALLASAMFTAILSGVLAVIGDNDTTVLLALFTMITSIVTAILGYLANKKGNKNSKAIQAVDDAVNAPREISTNREEGVRVEPPKTDGV